MPSYRQGGHLLTNILGKRDLTWVNESVYWQLKQTSTLSPPLSRLNFTPDSSDPFKRDRGIWWLWVFSPWCSSHITLFLCFSTGPSWETDSPASWSGLTGTSHVWHRQPLASSQRPPLQLSCKPSLATCTQYSLLNPFSLKNLPQYDFYWNLITKSKLQLIFLTTEETAQ